MDKSNRFSYSSPAPYSLQQPSTFMNHPYADASNVPPNNTGSPHSAFNKLEYSHHPTDNYPTDHSLPPDTQFENSSKVLDSEAPRSTPSPILEKGEKGKKKRRRPCLYACICFVVFLLLFAVGVLIFYFVFVTIPTVNFQQALASQTRPPFVLTPSGFSINFDLKFNVTNKNIFDIGVYELEMLGFLSNATGGPSDFNGTLHDINFARGSSTPLLFPVTYQFQGSSPNSQLVLPILMASCIPSAQQPSPPIKLRYQVRVGLSLIKFTGYKFVVNDATSFPCPFDLTSQLSQLAKQLT